MRLVELLLHAPSVAILGPIQPVLHLNRARVPIEVKGWGWLRVSGSWHLVLGRRALEFYPPRGQPHLLVRVGNAFGSATRVVSLKPTLREPPTIALPKTPAARLEAVHPTGIDVRLMGLTIRTRPFEIRSQALALSVRLEAFRSPESAPLHSTTPAKDL